MSVRVTQLSYNSGIMSGLMSGRADDTKYGSGLQVCRNARCTPQGPIENRPGFMYVAETKYPGKKARLIPFTYSVDQTMIIELGDRYVRFHTQGKTLMNSEGTAPYELATPWKEEDLFQIHYTQNAEVMTLVHPYYPPQELRRYSMTDWRLVPVSMVTSLQPPEGVTSVRLTSAANDSNSDKYEQTYVVTSLNEDRTEESEASKETTVKANLYATGTTVKVSWKTAPGAKYYRVYKLQGGIYGYIGETMETSIIDDNIAPETGQTPPYLDDVFQVSGGITNVEILNGGSGYKNGNRIVRFLDHGEVDRQWSGSWPDIEWRYNMPVTLPYPGTGGAHGSVHFDGIVDREGNGSGATASVTYGPDYNGYNTSVVKVNLTNDGGDNYVDPVASFRWTSGVADVLTARLRVFAEVEENPITLNIVDDTGYGGVLGFSIENGVFTDAWVKSAGRNYTDPTVQVISKNGSGARFKLTIGNAGDYPAAVGYFEQRRIFAGSRLRPQQIWMTATGTESNMTYHLPLQDDDRISFAVASRDLNQIQHVIALQQLLMLTSAAEWRVSPLNSDAITPTSISVRPQSYVGASSVQPVMANNTAIYAAARGGHIREIAYNYNAGGYVSGDLSLRATGLFDGYDILDLSFSKEPFPVVWAVSSSGSLLGLTYVPEQQVGAWFEYTTAGAFESVAVVQEGLDDVIYTITSRTINGETKRFVECSTRREDTTPRRGNFLDCSGEYFGDETTSVSGITWLAGQEVTVNADGAVVTGLKVGEDGTLTLPKKASRVVVGLPYSMEVRTMPIVAQVSDGSLAKGHTKNVSRVWLRLKNSAAPEVGSNFSDMAQVKTRTKETFGEPPRLIDGVIEALPPGKWEDDTGVCVRMDKPLPFTLISHSSEIELGG